MANLGNPSALKPKENQQADESSQQVLAGGQVDRDQLHIIYCLRVTSDRLVTGGYDRTVQVWTKPDMSLSYPALIGHASSVLALYVSVSWI
ncbi:hypothetical protein P154DRAFT_113091 [Amniculicola lignicola CBS 123094]|uniref:WD40 repeat-like protein n=1 Tax=Amniculicola lignicola CBS 123094 TaxID=1392246 RepID=A0A6A5WMG2_9PLEO|nr:hypothetical protein P154DRAFT_113091 [Amniculicola lignicola CBS 123094]